MIPGLLLAVTVHEVAHGWVADRLGDLTARLAGRLTLNPLLHIDPLGALAFVLAGFGWACPVPVSARNLRRPVRDMAWVAAAGPLSNFLVAFLGLVLLVLTWSWTRRSSPGRRGHAPLRLHVQSRARDLQPDPASAARRGHFLPYFFPRRSWPLLARLEQYGPFILLLLVFSGATRYIVGPLFGLVNALYLTAVAAIL